MRSQVYSFLAALGLALNVAIAHEGHHGSVHDTVAGVIERMKRTLPEDELLNLAVPRVEAFLTPHEREVLAREHIRFTASVPVVVTIVRDSSLGHEPFWLQDLGFNPAGTNVSLRDRKFDLWEKVFPAGHVGLGVPSLSGAGVHYLVLLRPRVPGQAVEVSGLYPAHLRTADFVAGVEPFVDQPIRLDAVPSQLEGQLLIRTDTEREEDAKLVSIFSKTKFPARNDADHAVLTWSADPRTTQTIQWRTSPKVRSGVVRYLPKSRGAGLNSRAARVKRAHTERLLTPMLLNDPLNFRHTVTLKGLKPGTAYVYSVGDGSEEGWTQPAEFTTAPAGPEPFAFIYMGDAQNGLDRWGVLLENAHRARPDAAFYLMAGDLVNRGAERWDWDAFFEFSKGVFNRRTIVPVIGNHECQGGAPELYLAQFTLPRNGPKGIEAERAYAFEYGNAKFIVLDSNLDPVSQTAWLERELANSKATWKFVSYHHPAYSSGGNRDNVRVRNLWTPIFDKYHVDLALQGHDHAYLRTYPMRGQQRVASPEDGTIYIISVSGTKHYAQEKHDYTEVGFVKVSTYQVLDIQIQGNRLVYRSHDAEGNVRDEFVIEKPDRR